MIEYLKSDGLADNWYDELSKVGRRGGRCRSGILFGRPLKKGEGTPIDYDEAFKWYKISAEAGNVEVAKKVKDFSEKY